MPIPLYPEEEEHADSSRPGEKANAATPRMTREQRAGLLGMILGFILCGIVVWMIWLVYSGVTHEKSVPGARAPLPLDEMLGAATVTVIGKAFVSTATDDGRVEGLRPAGRVDSEQIRIATELINTGSRDIRAIRGTIVFSDVFGEEIKSVSWTYEHGVKVGERRRYETELVYDAIIPSDQKLRVTPLADMKVRWEPLTIVFADGTTLRGRIR
jgi:hypothetical protein